MEKKTVLENSMIIDENPIKTVVDAAANGAQVVNINFHFSQANIQQDSSKNVAMHAPMKVKEANIPSPDNIDALGEKVWRFLEKCPPHTTLIDLGRAYIYTALKKGCPIQDIINSTGYSDTIVRKVRMLLLDG